MSAGWKRNRRFLGKASRVHDLASWQRKPRTPECLPRDAFEQYALRRLVGANLKARLTPVRHVYRGNEYTTAAGLQSGTNISPNSSAMVLISKAARTFRINI